ncbi:MAG: hypothetical protein GAK30_03188 [Paracidovorax wautersii]|uniref:Glycosyltransferase 2-like domain-containing protein n=1 Tax=Paracidovorax wautersii TaxID=1177982 RepID=A0A7V8FLM1_9BURK|nr:MAG: hypothetical protein GAK30_03188 [Paracidovorax wautersii]
MATSSSDDEGEGGGRPAVTVVLHVDGRSDALSLVLGAWAAQVERGFEVIMAVAGDGADWLHEAIAPLRPALPYALRMAFGRRGGRSSALNAAIALARSDYLVFSTADCLPRRDFLSTHLALRRPGFFLSGGHWTLPTAARLALEVPQVTSGACFQPAWLRRHGVPPRFWGLAWPFRNACNASGWASDLLVVNGFDERLDGEASELELAARLQHAGIASRDTGRLAVVARLGSAVKAASGWPAQALHRHLRRQVVDWTDHGLIKTEVPPG